MNTLPRVRYLLTFAGFALLVACDEPTGTDDLPAPQQPEQQQESQMGDQDTATLGANSRKERAFWLRTIGTDHPYVGPTELTCVRLDHADHIRQGTADDNHHAIRSLPAQCTVKALALQRVIDSLDNCAGGPITHAVTVHYGLNSTFYFMPALQIQCLEYDSNEEKYKLASSNDCWLIRPGGELGYVANGLTAWYAEGGEGKRYKDRVWVSKSPAMGFRKFDVDRDVRLDVFPYEATLAPLIAHNSLMASGSLEIVQISTPDKREDLGNGTYKETDFIAEIAWLPTDVTLDDAIDRYRTFKHKSADLGSPCPPSCPTEWFVFKERGASPRAECVPSE